MIKSILGRGDSIQEVLDVQEVKDDKDRWYRKEVNAIVVK